MKKRSSTNHCASLAVALMGAVRSTQARAQDSEENGFDVGGSLDALERHAVPWAVNIIGALLALFVGWLVASWVARKIRNMVDRRNLDATLGHFFANVARYLILVAVLLGVLGVFGIETSTFAAVIGAAGLAVGLAFQGTLSNFAAGVMLLAFRPFKVGDFIEAGDETGTVMEIEIFHTELKTPDAKRIIVPNNKIWSDAITNYGHYPQRRVDVDVGVGYSADTDQVRAVLQKVAEDIPNGLNDPAPVAFLKGLGDSSVNWQVRVWANTPDYWAVHEQTVRDVKKALDEAGISIPFPQMDVHLDR